MTAGGAAPPPRARRLWPWLLVAAAAGLVFATLPSPEASSSALSKAPSGLWTMRAYLQARGADLELLDAPLETDAPRPGVLLLTLPWQRFPARDLDQALSAHLRAGGQLIVAYEGTESPAQMTVFEALGLTPVLVLRDRPPLSPRGWWRHQRQTVELQPIARAAAAAPPRLEIPALDELPGAPAGADVLYTIDDLPAIFSFEQNGGPVLVLPVRLLANAHLADAGHADLLEALFGHFDGPWLIDEYHHGLIRSDLAARSASAYAWDLFAVHLLLLYGLAIFAAGRRFGPAWVERQAHTGSTGDFLRSLGVLHHQLGHHRDAAVHLLDRVRRLEPAVDLATLDAETVHDGRSLTDFAAALSGRRSSHGDSRKD